MTIKIYDLDTDLLAMVSRYFGEPGGARYIETVRDKFARGNGVKVVIKPKRWLSLDYNKP